LVARAALLGDIPRGILVLSSQEFGAGILAGVRGGKPQKSLAEKEDG